MWKNIPYIDDVPIDINEPVFPTGVVCRLIKIPVWVVKVLDNEGIISPPRRRGCDRLYSRLDLNRMHHVWTLMKKRRVTIGNIKVVLEIEGEMESHRRR